MLGMLVRYTAAAPYRQSLRVFALFGERKAVQAEGEASIARPLFAKQTTDDRSSTGFDKQSDGSDPARDDPTVSLGVVSGQRGLDKSHHIRIPAQATIAP